VLDADKELPKEYANTAMRERTNFSSRNSTGPGLNDIYSSGGTGLLAPLNLYWVPHTL